MLFTANVLISLKTDLRHTSRQLVALVKFHRVLEQRHTQTVTLRAGQCGFRASCASSACYAYKILISMLYLVIVACWLRFLQLCLHTNGGGPEKRTRHC